MSGLGRRMLVATIAAVTATLALVSGLAGPAAAQDENPGPFATIELEIDDDVPWDRGFLVAAEVRVTAERAVSGTLTVNNVSDGLAPTSFEFDIDLAAGSTVVFPVDLFSGWNGVEVNATLTSNQTVLATDMAQAFGQGASATNRIGFLGIDDPPARISDLGDEEQHRTFILDGRLRGLHRASSVVATPGAVAALGVDGEEALALEAWLRGGGQLVIDGPGESLDDRYHQYRTANPNRFEVGAGSVVYRTDWRDGVPLGGYLGSGGVRELVNNQNLGVGSNGELAILADISLPSAILVGGSLLVYSLLAGPIAFGVLGVRRQHRRIWIVLPALSLLFVVGILGFGFATRSGRTDIHITIVEVNEQASRVTTNVLLNSGVGGSRALEVPSTWTYLGQGQGQVEAQRPVQVRSGGTTTEIAFDMPPGATAVARLSGVNSSYDGLLRIENIAVDGDELTASVTNAGTGDLVEAVAFFGNARTEIGDLVAGETTAVRIDLTDPRRTTMQELLIWPRVQREWVGSGEVAIPTDDGAVTAAGAWTEWRIEQGSAALPVSTIGVVGWTDSLAGPLPGLDEGRTALFTRANLPTEVRRQVGPSTVAEHASRNGEPAFDGNFQGFSEDYRITLADAGDLDQLLVVADRNAAALGFFTPDGYRYVSLPGNGEVELSVPPEAVIDGEINLRAFTAPWTWGAGLTVHVESGQPPAPLPLVEQPQYRNVEEFFGPDPGPDFGGAPGGFPRQADLGLTTELVADDIAETEEPFVLTGEISASIYDVVLLDVEEGQSVLIGLTADGGGDPFLELVGPDGFLVAANDDGAGSLNSEIEVSLFESGTYEIRAHELSGGILAYELTVEVER